MTDQCPGCGSMRGCDCTPTSIRARLVKDRAELSDRAAGYTKRANEAARLIRLCSPHRKPENVSREDAARLLDDVDVWLDVREI